MQTKPKSFAVVVLICVGVAAIVWFTISKNQLGFAKVPAGAEKPEGDVAAFVGGTRVSLAEIDKRVNAQLSRMRADEYNLKRRALDEAITRILLEAEAKTRGTSVEELTRVEIDAKAAAVLAGDKQAEYNRLKERFTNKTEAELTRMANDNLSRRSIVERRRQFIAELRNKTDIRILLEPPRFEVDATEGPSLGPPNAPVTIVEFSEFQCPYCAQVQPTLKRIKEHFGDNVRIVFRNFPLPRHEDAPKAAEAASCADEQGKFWEMHDKLFANNSKLRVENLKTYAAELGLETDRFNECLDTGRLGAKWRTDKRDGGIYGVTGTPAFFINGRMVGGSVPYEEFLVVIQEELKRAQKPAHNR
jgi:predicted DsbA family dithiol-disulfide isomerase